jgi:hypothetical protein
MVGFALLNPPYDSEIFSDDGCPADAQCVGWLSERGETHRVFADARMVGFALLNPPYDSEIFSDDGCPTDAQDLRETSA